VTGMLARDTVLSAGSGEEVTITAFIGAGGQGEVYEVQHRGASRALKWYYPASATETQQAIVEDLVTRKVIDDRFLWPLALVTGNGFGYLMKLRPPNFEGLPALFRRQVRIKSRELVTACIHLVEAYRVLHSQGIAYRDISQGNVFFDPATGDILVCDNDNAVVDGKLAEIEGTMEFMAPELVRADAGAIPCTQTDLHSLAVLLFMMLMNHHPLLGAREYRIRLFDEKAQALLYGREPIFVFDPDNDSNRPVPGYHDTVLATWDAAPGSLRELFSRAFTDGLHEPGRRIRETQWRDALSAVRDMIVSCSRCASQNMTDPGEIGARHCWSCGTRLPSQAVAEIITASPRRTRIIALTAGMRIFAHHLTSDPARHDFSAGAAAAIVAEHPRVPGRLGLRNLTDSVWIARRPDGSTGEIPPGRSIDIAPGTRLRLDAAEAVIRRRPA
jgi:DNA-binding helix-hairpin-helix protein with protein kinase domain